MLVLVSSVHSPPSQRFDHRNFISCTYAHEILSPCDLYFLNGSHFSLFLQLPFLPISLTIEPSYFTQIICYPDTYSCLHRQLYDDELICGYFYILYSLKVILSNSSNNLWIWCILDCKVILYKSAWPFHNCTFLAVINLSCNGDAYYFSFRTFWDYISLLNQETENWFRFITEQSEFSLVLPKTFSD